MKNDKISILEKFNILGTWWLPDSEVRESGIISFNPDGGITLDIFGPLDNSSFGIKKYDIVYGLTSEAKLVTLINCIASSGIASTSSVGAVYPTRVQAERMIIGTKLSAGKDDDYDNIRVSIHNFNEFIGWTSLRLDRNETGVSASWNKYQPVNLELSNAKVSILLTCHPSQTFFSEIRITEGNAIDVHIEGRRITVDEALNGPIASLHALINFAIGYRVPLLSISGIDNVADKEDDDQVYVNSADIFFRQITTSSSSKKIPGPHMLFSLMGFSEDIKVEIMSKWDSFYSNNRAALDMFLYADIHGDIDRSVEYIFLQMVGTIEALHRVSECSNKQMETSEFKVLIEKIKTCLGTDSIETREFVIGKLSSSNEVSLKKRLDDFLVMVPRELMNGVSDLGVLSKEIVDIRTRYIHHVSGHNRTDIDILRVWTLSNLMWGVTVVFVFINLGFDKEFIISRCTNSMYLLRAFHGFYEK